MTPSSNAHRAEFTVRCACGIEYHTSDAHIGRLLPCSCGRKIKVERPAPTASSEKKRTIDPAPKKTHKTVRRRRSAPVRKYTGDSRAGRAWHSISVFLASTLRPLFYGTRVQRIAASLAWGYFAAMLLAWIALYFTSEELLPGTIIAYGPRWLALWPLVALVPFSAIVARKTLVPLLVAAYVCVSPIMGARISPTTLLTGGLPSTPAPGTFRLISFNTESGRALARDLPVMLREQAPDFVTFQECGNDLWNAMQAMPGWHLERDGSLCTGSRWPIGATELMPRADLARISSLGFGGSGLVMRTLIATPHGPLVLVNLHLETARKGLEGFLGREGFVPDLNSSMTSAPEADDNSAMSSMHRFSVNAEIRLAESARASRWVSQPHAKLPLIIAGDFNLPVESSIFRKYWTHFTDAFEATGNGLGWSKREGRWLRIRIDHVLTDDAGPKPLGIMLGPDYGSDHLPVIVDFRWPDTTAKH